VPSGFALREGPLEIAGSRRQVCEGGVLLGTLCGEEAARAETRSAERNRRPNSPPSAFIAHFIARSIELSQIALRFLKSFVRGNVAQVFRSRLLARSLSLSLSLSLSSDRHLGERISADRPYRRVTISLAGEQGCRLKKPTYYKRPARGDGSLSLSLSLPQTIFLFLHFFHINKPDNQSSSLLPTASDIKEPVCT